MVFSSSASAAYVAHGNGNDNTMIIGCVSLNGGAPKVQVCVDGIYTALSDNCTLNNSAMLEGEAGNDYMIIVRSTVSLNCGGGGGDTRTWYAMTWGTHYIDLYGEGDDDDLLGSDQDTYLTGSTGEDWLKNWAPEGVNTGGDNNDRVMSLAASDGDSVDGGYGDDCVDDRSGDWAAFSCGPGDDYYYDGEAQGSPNQNCDHQLAYCCDPISCS
jgi:hypothetical protein